MGSQSDELQPDVKAIKAPESSQSLITLFPNWLAIFDVEALITGQRTWKGQIPELWARLFPKPKEKTKRRGEPKKKDPDVNLINLYVETGKKTNGIENKFTINLAWSIN